MNRHLSRALLTVVFVAALFPSVASASSGDGDIYGGESAPADAYPFMVALYEKANGPYDGHYCGGTLIAADWVLTAAHCVYYQNSQENLAIYAGSNDLTSGGVTSDIAELHMHPNFVRSTLENDLALIRTAEPLVDPQDLNAVIRPAEDGNPSYAAGTITTIAGWGENDEPPQHPMLLREVEVPLVDSGWCEDFHANRLFLFTSEKNICAGWPEGGKDACSGDSGGPLFVEDEEYGYIELGVVSWGTGCGDAGEPAVYTKLSAFTSWIAAVAFCQIEPTPEVLAMDTILGTPFNDNITGTAGDDLIAAAGGSDIVFAGEGDDIVCGGAGGDDLSGEGGDDMILGNAGADDLRGDGGNDFLHGGTGADRGYAGPGDDTVEGGFGNDQLWGEDGNDTLIGGSGQDQLFGGEGADTLSGKNHDDQLDGGPGDDVLSGDRGDDIVFGMEGADTLEGGNHDDALYGGDGDDIISGKRGRDRLFGELGDDQLFGGDGDDQIDGGDGTDLGEGGKGVDQCSAVESGTCD